MKLTTQISLGFLIAISVDVVTTVVNYALDARVNTEEQALIIVPSQEVILDSMEHFVQFHLRNMLTGHE